MFPRLKKLLVGSPLSTSDLPHQRLSKKAALAVLASDNLSITAYATEEILLVFPAAVAAGVMLPLHVVLPLSLAVVLLIAIVVASYSQTMYAYPTGGGAYTVAKENLGVGSALVGGAALLLDYILTVAVSVAAGIAAITSAVPELYPYRVSLCVLTVAVILLINLRGARESAAVFAGPVYFFILIMFVFIAGGLVKYLQGGLSVLPAAEAGSASVWDAVYVFYVLRAFSHGCVALTGVEAIANGVRIFRPPVSRNAAITLWAMGGLTAFMFLGTSFLATVFNFAHGTNETLVSQMAREVFGTGAIYYSIQFSTTAILLLATNTCFADFPRLASVIAKDRFLPRQLANLGDRLVFSNGMIVLALVAIVLLVAFQGDVHSLIPLYMVGVFLAFTLSQAGMVVHWRRSSERGRIWRMALNAVGAAATGLVLMIVAVVKFQEGAWMVVFALAAVVFLFRKVRSHYYEVGRQLSLADFETPRPARHTVIIPVPASPNRVVLTAVEYAKSVSRDVIAVHVSTNGDQREELVMRWKKFVHDVPLLVFDSPYRSVLRPLLRFIDEIELLRPDDKLTILLPEFVPGRWWHGLLHNHTSLLFKGALLFRPGIVVTSVSYHLGGNSRRRANGEKTFP
jgi:amino acid transporter